MIVLQPLRDHKLNTNAEKLENGIRFSKGCSLAWATLYRTPKKHPSVDGYKFSLPHVNSYYKMHKVGFQIIQESVMKLRIRFDSNRREDLYVPSAAGLEKEMDSLMLLSAGKALERGKTSSSVVGRMRYLYSLHW